MSGKLAAVPRYGVNPASRGGARRQPRPGDVRGGHGSVHHGTVRADGRAWIARLPADLDGQRRILEKLLTWCETDDRVRWLVLGCSVARGAGDHLSDLDMAIGVRDEDFAASAADVREAVGQLGDLVESFHHQLPGVTDTHERIFAQFADRCQVDLVVFPASVPAGSIPRLVVLYDPDERVVLTGERPATTPGQVREWAFLGWCALADLAKYLRRGSAWEALERLNEARSQLWRLLAVAGQVPDPQYGLTSIVDFAPGQLPATMQGTMPGLHPERLLAAARQVASLLSETGRRLPADCQEVLPEAMARFVLSDLAALPAPAPLAPAPPAPSPPAPRGPAAQRPGQR